MKHKSASFRVLFAVKPKNSIYDMKGYEGSNQPFIAKNRIAKPLFTHMKSMKAF